MKTGGTKAEQQLIAELCHQINSPLAAIRNALYLSATRNQDPQLQRYLRLANAEISTIAGILRQARLILEATTPPEGKRPNASRHAQSRRAAA